MRTPAATPAARRRAGARAARGVPAKGSRRARPATAARRRRAGAPARLAHLVAPLARLVARLRAFMAWRYLAAAGLLAAALAVTYFAWFRDSSFVAVREVKVEGVSGTDRGAIVDALTRAGGTMTTLHVREDRLAAAVSRFPVVASVSADASLPHGLTIHVTERDPVLIVSDGDRRVAVSRDGALLPGVEASAGLPKLAVDSIPASGRLGGEPLAETQAVGAAPPPLRPLISGVDASQDQGIVVTMRGGIELRLGTSADAKAKWAAAAAVLADPRTTTLSYVDVRVPGRPAVG